MRVFCVSDLHTDHSKNQNIISKWRSSNAFNKEDVLIIAGDISSNLSVLEWTFKTVLQTFGTICYTFGNNELRLRSKDNPQFNDSTEKFSHVMKLCKSLGIHTGPFISNGVCIVPIHGWYSPYFASSYDGKTEYQKRFLDFRTVRWPDQLSDNIELPQNHFSLFSIDQSVQLGLLTSKSTKSDSNSNNAKLQLDELELNENQLKTHGIKKMITFSHFLPRAELLPYFTIKNLNLISGSSNIELLLRKLKSDIHVCGHIHVNFQKQIDGVWYIQNALAHPHEQKKTYEPKLIFDSNKEEGEDFSNSSNCNIM